MLFAWAEEEEEGELITWNNEARNWFYSFVNEVRNQNLKEKPNKVIPNAKEDWRGKILYITDLVIGNISFPRIVIYIPISNNSIETNAQIIDISKTEKKGLRQIIQIGDFEVMCLSEKPWNCAFFTKTEFTVSGWNSFVDLECVQYNPDLNINLKDYLLGKNLETQDLKRYIVSEDKANIRSIEAPYNIIKPEVYLEKGREVVLISLLETGEKSKALVRYKGETKEYCTFIGNLKEIISVDDKNEYKIGRDTKSLILPYSQIENENIKALSIYIVKELCGDFSHIYEKDGNKNIDKGWVNTSSLIKYNNFDNLTLQQKNDLILKKSKVATEVASEMTSGTACNYCVRNALYLIKSEPALFPKTAPYATYRDPDNNYKAVKVLGYITEPAQAIDIKRDFDKIESIRELDERFVEIPRNDNEELQDYFQRLQNEADKGTIIIGVMLNDSGTEGHVMMITPGGLITIDENELDWGGTYTTRGIKKVLRVLECGDKDRDNEAPLCRNVDRKGAQERLKWFKYNK
jgi:hypothetical protein